MENEVSFIFKYVFALWLLLGIDMVNSTIVLPIMGFSGSLFYDRVEDLVFFLKQGVFNVILHMFLAFLLSWAFYSGLTDALSCLFKFCAGAIISRVLRLLDMAWPFFSLVSRSVSSIYGLLVEYIKVLYQKYSFAANAIQAVKDRETFGCNHTGHVCPQCDELCQDLARLNEDKQQWIMPRQQLEQRIQEGNDAYVEFHHEEMGWLDNLAANHQRRRMGLISDYEDALRGRDREAERNRQEVITILQEKDDMIHTLSTIIDGQEGIEYQMESWARDISKLRRDLGSMQRLLDAEKEKRIDADNYANELVARCNALDNERKVTIEAHTREQRRRDQLSNENFNLQRRLSWVEERLVDIRMA